MSEKNTCVWIFDKCGYYKIGCSPYEMKIHHRKISGFYNDGDACFECKKEVEIVRSHEGGENVHYSDFC